MLGMELDAGDSVLNDIDPVSAREFSLFRQRGDVKQKNFITKQIIVMV